MRTHLLILSAALTLGGVSALTLSKPTVYTVPGADSHLAAFLPGGQVTVDADNAVMILDQNLKTVRAWYSLQGAVKGLGASPDGTRVAALGRDRWIVWDTQTGQELRSGKAEYDTTVAFAADGTLIMLKGGAVTRLNLGTGQTTDLLGEGDAYDVRVSPDGTLAAVIYEDHVDLVTLADAKVVASSEISDDWDGLEATFSPDAQAAVIRTGSETLILRAGAATATAVEGGKELSLDGSVMFLNAAQFLYAEYGEGQLFDAQSGAVIGDPLELDSVDTLVGGPEGQVLSLGGSVGRLNLDTLDAPARPQVKLPSANTWTGAFIGGVPHAGLGDFINLKTGKGLNVGNRDRLYAAETQGAQVWTLNGSGSVSVYRAGKIVKLPALSSKVDYQTLHTSPDGRYAAVTGYEGLALLDGQTGKLVAQFTPAQLKVKDIHDALPTPDGKAVLVIPHEGNPLRLDVKTGKTQPTVKLPADASSEEFQQSRGGTLAVAYSLDEQSFVALTKPGATTPFKTLKLNGTRALRFSPDGKLLAVLTNDAQNALQLFDTASGNLLFRTGQFSLTTHLISWSDNGAQLMVGAGQLGQPGSVSVYDVNR